MSKKKDDFTPPVENSEPEESRPEEHKEPDPKQQPEDVLPESTPNGEEANAEVVVGYTLEEVDQMQQELEEARNESADYKDRWQRAMADFQNLRRRTARDQVLMKERAIGEIVSPFLDVLDDLELAINNHPEEGEGAAWFQGIELIYRKLSNVLDVQGIKTMEVEEQFFDPNYHEAISQEPNENFESGQIIDVVKQGYLIGDRVLRPAMVRVAA